MPDWLDFDCIFKICCVEAMTKVPTFKTVIKTNMIIYDLVYIYNAAITHFFSFFNRRWKFLK